eukprot:1114104-Amphidinium_carterae.1
MTVQNYSSVVGTPVWPASTMIDDVIPALADRSIRVISIHSAKCQGCVRQYKSRLIKPLQIVHSIPFANAIAPHGDNSCLLGGQLEFGGPSGAGGNPNTNVQQLEEACLRRVHSSRA